MDNFEKLQAGAHFLDQHFLTAPVEENVSDSVVLQSTVFSSDIVARIRFEIFAFTLSPVSCQIPIILALLGIWYHNFYGAESYTLLPYDQVRQRSVLSCGFV